MENLLKIRIFLILLLSSFSMISAADITIYRWVDENNVAHFSQKQPEHDNYTTMTMANTQAPSPAPIENEKINNENEQVDEDKEFIAKENNKRCEEAKANLTTLENHKQVKYIDSDGKQHVLSKSDKEEQTVMTKKQIELYCS